MTFHLNDNNSQSEMRILFYMDSPGTFCGLSRVMAMIIHKAGGHTDSVAIVCSYVDLPIHNHY